MLLSHKGVYKVRKGVEKAAEVRQEFFFAQHKSSAEPSPHSVQASFFSVQYKFITCSLRTEGLVYLKNYRIYLYYSASLYQNPLFLAASYFSSNARV